MSLRYADGITFFERIVFGVMGGLSPYAIRLVRAVGEQPGPPAHTAVLIGGIVSAAFLGALASVTLDSHNRFIAVYHGAGAPTFFSFIMHG